MRGKELRKSRFTSKLLLGAAFLAALAESALAEETVRLEVASGAIRGVREGNIQVYKGIPYAKPPLGERRFAPPEDAEPWAGERDCTRFGSQCFQVSAFAGSEPFSEDCLTLNVWTPARPGEDAKLPVYVFIHGGGFAAGAGSLAMYSGAGFAKKGIVAVTINYRLGVLGFFASQETFKQYGTTGNWGLLDQIKALEWVRDNIAAFGGDPGKVTVGGESAGSFSVSSLVTSPLAKGLFRGAIMESGSVLSLPTLSYYARSDLRKSIGSSGAMAEVFGALDDADGLAKMRKADPAVLAYFDMFNASPSTIPAFFLTPVFDGKVIPTNPLGAMTSGNFAKVNLLLGFNNDEGSMFVPEQANEEIYKTLTILTFGGEKGLHVLDRFKTDARHTPLQRARQTVAYGIFSAGMKRFADIAAEAGAGVYLYKFKYVAPEDGRKGLGATHAAELPFVFDTLASGGLSGPEAEKLAGEMHTRWANFIKSGDPNVGGGPLPSGVKWPKYDPKEAEVLYLDEKITSGPLEDKENIDYIADLTFGPGAYSESK